MLIRVKMGSFNYKVYYENTRQLIQGGGRNWFCLQTGKEGRGEDREGGTKQTPVIIN